MLDENKNNNTSQGWTAWDIGKYILTAAGALSASYFGFSYWSLLFQGEQESVGVALADDSLVDVSHVLESVTMTDNVPHQSAVSRKLLSTNVTVINPIPDQQVEAAVEYRYSIDPASIFSGDVIGFGVFGLGETPLPSWLGFDAVVNSYETPGLAKGIVLEGSTLFVADWASGLQVLDVNDPANITFLGSYETLGVAYDVAIQGNTAYVAGYWNGLFVLDVSNLAAITLLGSFSTPGVALDVALDGDVAYVADNPTGLLALDVSNPVAITLLDGYATPGPAYGVVLKDNTAYVASFNSGLQVLNVSDPANISFLDSYNTLGTTGVTLHDDMLFLTGSRIHMFNVSNPTNINLLGSYVTLVNAQDITVQGSRAYVANHMLGLLVLDISNPATVILLSNFDTLETALGVVLRNDRVIVADDSSGLQVLDVSKGELVGTATTALVGQVYELEVKGFIEQGQQVTDIFSLLVNQLPKRQDNSLTSHTLFPDETLRFALDSETLFIDPDNTYLQLAIDVVGNKNFLTWLNFHLKPTFLIGYDPLQLGVGGGLAYDIVFEGNIAYIAFFSSGLLVLDVSNPAEISVLGSYDTPGLAYDLVVQGNTVYVADDLFGLQVLDVSDPANINLLGNYITPDRARGVTLHNGMVFVADRLSGLQILNISNPSNITLTGSYDTPHLACEVTLVGDVAYVADDDSGLQVLDVGNPAAITLLGSYDTLGGAQSIVLQGSMAFVADGVSGLQVLDVSNPAAITLIGSYDTPGEASTVVLIGSTAFVADGVSGIQVLDVSNPASISLFGSYNTPGRAHDVALLGNKAYVAVDSSGLQIIDMSQWELTANPTAADVGNYEIILTATDALGGTASDSFTIRVEGPPSFNGTIPNQALSVGEAYNYFVPQGIVVDPNDDAVTFSAELNNGGMLPSWLSFNPFSAAFAGTPDAAGQYTIKLSATDNIAGSTSTTFDLLVTHKPKVQQPIIDPAPWRVGREFTFTIPTNAFVDLDGNTLVYSAILNDGSPLPSWLQFDASTGTFTGIPPVGELNALDVVVTATDTSTGSTASQSFTLSITPNLPPQVDNPISVQSADVNKAFGFTVPSNTFSDPNQDPLTYSASRVGGSTLPSWLHFFPESRRFAGEPGRGDTGTLKDGVVGVEVIASDGEQSASTAFNINVKGASHLELALTVGGPIIGFLSLLAACYGSRAYCLNRMNKSTYQKLQQTVHVGEAGGVIALEADANKVHKVQAKMQRPAPTNCCGKFGRLFRSSRQAIPGCTLPHWLEYNPLTNDLEIVDGGPTEHEVGEIIIQVKDKAGITLEQFPLQVVSQQHTCVTTDHVAGDEFNPIFDNGNDEADFAKVNNTETSFAMQTY